MTGAEPESIYMSVVEEVEAFGAGISAFWFRREDAICYASELPFHRLGDNFPTYFA